MSHEKTHSALEPPPFGIVAWTGVVGVILITIVLLWAVLTGAGVHEEHDDYATDTAHVDDGGDGHTEDTAAADDAHAASKPEPHVPRLWGIGILPFVALLLCIAILPLLGLTHHWWESNANRLGVATICGLVALVYYLVIDHAGFDGIAGHLRHAVLKEYIPFIVLLFALYAISGGIVLRGDLAAHPLTNTAFLAIGAAIASFIGTTGASMLLIRPLLKTNSERRHVVHTVVFFIFLVSNVGGSLLPIGDPPLFMGYLKGVDFFWTLGLWPMWALCCVILLVVYYVWDTIAYRNEAVRDIRLDETQKQPLRLDGSLNFLWLLGVVLCVILVQENKPIAGTSLVPFPFLRELLMLGFVAIAYRITPRRLREANSFNFAAILEVAALFLGIFIAMQVPVEVLSAKGAALGLTESWQFFWATGSLSAFLDNAPTYVVFFETAGALSPETFDETIIDPDLLVGISLGAVFMGAMTYIGNGPNFMVKSIAEQSGVRMPSFFGYLFRYAVPVLVPIFVIITVVFMLGD